VVPVRKPRRISLRPGWLRRNYLALQIPPNSDTKFLVACLFSNSPAGFKVADERCSTPLVPPSNHRRHLPGDFVFSPLAAQFLLFFIAAPLTRLDADSAQILAISPNTQEAAKAYGRSCAKCRPLVYRLVRRSADGANLIELPVFIMVSVRKWDHALHRSPGPLPQCVADCGWCIRSLHPLLSTVVDLRRGRATSRKVLEREQQAGRPSAIEFMQQQVSRLRR